jgi:hypothetical protein
MVEGYDMSPPRRTDGRWHGSKRQIAVPEVIDAPQQITYAGTTLEGKRAGLQKASDLRDEMVEFRRKENELFSTVRLTYKLLCSGRFSRNVLLLLF